MSQRHRSTVTAKNARLKQQQYKELYNVHEGKRHIFETETEKRTAMVRFGYKPARRSRSEGWNLKMAYSTATAQKTAASR